MTNSQICVDANIIIWSLVAFPLSDAAANLLYEWRQTDITLVAPALLAYEVAATLRRLVYLKEITPVEGDEAFARYQRLPIELVSPAHILPLAWQLAKDLNRSRTYDTAYLAVAQFYQCHFWTADEKLYNAVQGKLPWVHWLGNYHAP